MPANFSAKLRKAESMIEMAERLKVIRNQNTSLGELASKIDVEGTLKTRLSEILATTGGADDIIRAKREASDSLFVKAFGNILRIFDTSFSKMVASKRADVLL